MSAPIPDGSERFRDLMQLTHEQIFRMSQIVPTQVCPCCEGPGFHTHEISGATMFGLPMLVIRACDTCNGQGRVLRIFAN